MYRYLTNKRLPRLLALSVFISTKFDLVSAVSSCSFVGLCPLPSGLTGSGFVNGIVDPWPPAKDTGTSEPCLPLGKDKISFKCNDGFRLQTTKIELFCDPLFDWNLKAPTCVEDVSVTGLSADDVPPPCAKCSDETLMLVIIILSVLLSISWLIIILIFICKRDALTVANTRETVIVHGDNRPTAPVVGHTIHEPVMVHGERRPMITQSSNISKLELSERPPMPEPRTDATEQREHKYDYVDRNKLTKKGEADYLELEK